MSQKKPEHYVLQVIVKGFVKRADGKADEIMGDQGLKIFPETTSVDDVLVAITDLVSEVMSTSKGKYENEGSSVLTDEKKKLILPKIPLIH
jgi:hypothetical protein